jgi:hypothetical protein
MNVVSGHPLGCQEWVDPIKVASGDAGSQEVVIMTSHIPGYGNGDGLICIFSSFLI